jgi:hypothetical protein
MEATDTPAARPAAATLLRQIVVACQAATILVTWPLWQARAEPPLLPLLPVPALPFGAALLATLAVALVRPRLGAALHGALLAVAITADQTREQPQVLSLALLLASGVWPRARALGALHLPALWFWSGLGKLLSPRFPGEGGAWLLGAAADPGLACAAAFALGGAEVALAALALGARTRRTAAALAVLLHASILGFLVLRSANPAVWPWNAALAVAAPCLLRADPGITAARCSRSILACAAVLFVLLPLGWHAGLVDRAFSHAVYTLDGPRAVWLPADGGVAELGELPGLRVTLPPQPRVLAAYFAATARDGDALAILESRRLARALGAGDRLLRRPTGRAP